MKHAPHLHIISSTHRPFGRPYEHDELARILGDIDHAEALNDNHPVNRGGARLLAASTWASIGVALFAFWYFAGQLIRGWVS